MTVERLIEFSSEIVPSVKSATKGEKTFHDTV